MIDTLRPILSRVLAAWLPALLFWIGDKLGLQVSAEMIESVVAFAIWMIIYAISHKFIDAKFKVNPGDAASPAIVATEKREVQP